MGTTTQHSVCIAMGETVGGMSADVRTEEIIMSEDSAVPRQLIKAIASWAVGLGLSAIPILSTALAQQSVTPEQLTAALEGAVNTLSAEIRGARSDLQTQITRLQRRFDDHMRDETTIP